jgi:hypothetical protein
VRRITRVWEATTREAVRAEAEAISTGEISPLPVFPYRRVRIQRDQGRGRVRIQVHCAYPVPTHCSSDIILLFFDKIGSKSC